MKTSERASPTTMNKTQPNFLKLAYEIAPTNN